jgi:hypothetical protein
MTFKTSSFCNWGECVEVSVSEHGVLMRDSKDPEHVLEFTPEEWDAFLKGVKAGEFDPGES